MTRRLVSLAISVSALAIIALTAQRTMLKRLFCFRPSHLVVGILGGGALVSIEPDYGGMIEHPEELALRDVWIAALRRAGADPLVGRKLPGVLAAAGFRVRVDLVDRLEPPADARFRLLEELPLDESQRRRLEAARRFDAGCPAWAKTVHLPFFLVSAEKRASG